MTSPLRRNRPITASAAPTATTRRLKRWLAVLACSLAGPVAALGQTPPELPPSPVTYPPSLPPMPTTNTEHKRTFGYWQGDRFIPVGTNGQPVPSQSVDEFTIPLDPPTPEQLFQHRGEQGLYEYVLEEYRKIDPNLKPQFPPAAQLVAAGVTFTGRPMPPAASQTFPGYLCYQPLYFEEKNAERYGWEFGVWQPFISAGYFYKDLAFLPYNMGTTPPWSCVTNAGLCLPGDCVPYTFYVPPFSWRGVAAETGTLVGGAAAWP